MSASVLLLFLFFKFPSEESLWFSEKANCIRQSLCM